MEVLPSDGKPLAVVTSWGSLHYEDSRRREVRIPELDGLSRRVALIHDIAIGMNVPAVVGITGRYAGVGQDAHGVPVAQWQASVHPYHDRVRQRVALSDHRDAVDALHAELMRLNPMRGATYTAYFSVPPHATGASQNLFDCSFACAAVRRRERERDVARSGSLRVALVHVLGLDRIKDPWLDDEATYERVASLLQARLTPVMTQLWSSWTKDPAVAMLLGGQGVPIAAHRQTMYQPGNARRHIRERLPAAMQQTMFAGRLPDLEALSRPEPGLPPTFRNPLVVATLVVAVIGALFLAFA